MVMEEIYLLNKHARMSADYIERIPVYKRRFYLNMLKTELDDQKAANDKAASKMKSNNFSKGRR
jgi:hypothetical protein